MKLCILATLISFSDLIYAAEKTLQSIENLDDDELRTDEGNEFKLIQLNTGCKIEARFFLSYQNILSSYIFQNNALKLITGNQQLKEYFAISMKKTMKAL